MREHSMLLRVHFILSLLVCLALVTTAISPVVAAPRPRIPENNITQNQFEDTLFRTRITLRRPRDLQRAQELGAQVLQNGEDWALVLVNGDQLADLARLRFSPGETDSLTNLGFDGRAAPLSAAAMDAITHAPMSDDDGDGLSNTLESWWCTDPGNPDSDNDGTDDGDEVYGLKAYLDDPSLPRPATGKPFSGWPPSHPDCDDSDQDSVPDSAEDWLGLNRNRESTDRDKFDDGQELFGNTYCTGAGGYCSYGSLPRDGDWGVIFAEMPSWVHKPFDSPFVAAFPIIEIAMVENSLQVDRKVVIRTEEGDMTQTTNTYETSVTNGTSSGIENATTWNNWEETSETTEATGFHHRIFSPDTNGYSVNNYQAASAYYSSAQYNFSSQPGGPDWSGISALLDLPGKAWNTGRQWGEGINEAIYLTALYGAPWDWNGHLNEYNDEQARAELNKCKQGQTCRDPATGRRLIDGGHYLDFVHLDPYRARRQSPQSGFCVAITPHI